MFNKRLVIALTALSFMLSISLMAYRVNPASAYTLIGGKQNFYSPGVVAFNWGNLTDTDTIWRQAFLQASYNWDSTQSTVSWGRVSSGTNNIMQVYYAQNSYEYGRTQLSISSGIITKAWMEINQYSLQNKSWNFKVSVAGHEQGHGFGLGESSVDPALMNQSRDRETIYKPQADDIRGINDIY